MGISLTGVAEAQPLDQDSEATLDDRYRFSVIAWTNVGDNEALPFAISSYYQFDGDGTLIGKDVVSDARGEPGEVFERDLFWDISGQSRRYGQARPRVRHRLPTRGILHDPGAWRRN